MLLHATFMPPSYWLPTVQPGWRTLLHNRNHSDLVNEHDSSNVCAISYLHFPLCYHGYWFIIDTFNSTSSTWIKAIYYKELFEWWAITIRKPTKTRTTFRKRLCCKGLLISFLMTFLAILSIFESWPWRWPSLTFQGHEVRKFVSVTAFIINSQITL